MLVFIAIVILVVLTVVSIQFKTDKKKSMNAHYVNMINQSLRYMDGVKCEALLRQHYNNIKEYASHLPDDIMLNNMRLQDALRLIEKEYAENLERINADNTVDTDSNIIDLGNGNVRVKWDYLNGRFLKGAVMDDDLFWSWNGRSEYADIQKSKLDEMEQKRTEYTKREQSTQRIAILNNKGMELEKRGEIQEAINIYEQNISYGDCDAIHPYDRLMILYRKRKDYVNEKKVVKKAIAMFPTIERYRDRLIKIEVLNIKHMNHD